MKRLAAGVDLVCVDEVQEALESFGERYVSRVFTPHEVACSPGVGLVRGVPLSGTPRRQGGGDEGPRPERPAPGLALD